MESKSDSKADSKHVGHKEPACSKGDGGRYVDESLFSDEKDISDGAKAEEDCAGPPMAQITVLELNIRPSELVEITSPLSLDIRFELDRDVIAGYWVVQFLVDSCQRRVIRVLGETPVEDYSEGESDVHFEVERVEVDGIEASTLTNAGLLMAKFMADGEEIASVNMVSRLVQVCLFS